jgi:predicted Zn-dependent peptidase
MGQITVGKVQKAIREYIERAKKEGRPVTQEEIDQVTEAALAEETWKDKDAFRP